MFRTNPVKVVDLDSQHSIASWGWLSPFLGFFVQPGDIFSHRKPMNDAKYPAMCELYRWKFQTLLQSGGLISNIILKMGLVRAVIE